jgi:hypothetical protein
MIGVGDDMFVSGGYCACFDDGGSKSGITETVGFAGKGGEYCVQLENRLLQYLSSHGSA